MQPQLAQRRAVALHRFPLGAIATVLLTSMATSPAAAFEVLKETGVTGEYKVIDKIAKPGVVCKYEDHDALIDEELERIRIRSVKTKGARAAKRWVGYRFLIARTTPAMGPD